MNSTAEQASHTPGNSAITLTPEQWKYVLYVSSLPNFLILLKHSADVSSHAVNTAVSSGDGSFARLTMISNSVKDQMTVEVLQ